MAAENKKDSTFILVKDATICGIVQTNESALVNGIIKGGLATTKNLVLGQTGQINGPVMASNAVVDGFIEGNLNCRGPVRLGAAAKMYGDVECTSLMVSDGAEFVGKVSCKQIVGADAPGTGTL